MISLFSGTFFGRLVGSGQGVTLYSRRVHFFFFFSGKTRRRGIDSLRTSCEVTLVCAVRG